LHLNGFSSKIIQYMVEAEIIPKNLDLAFLQGPPSMEIGVVALWTVSLVATSQKTTRFASFGH
jgi:hypothetical protein